MYGEMMYNIWLVGYSLNLAITNKREIEINYFLTVTNLETWQKKLMHNKRHIEE